MCRLTMRVDVYVCVCVCVCVCVFLCECECERVCMCTRWPFLPVLHGMQDVTMDSHTCGAVLAAMDAQWRTAADTARITAAACDVVRLFAVDLSLSLAPQVPAVATEWACPFADLTAPPPVPSGVGTARAAVATERGPVGGASCTCSSRPSPHCIPAGLQGVLARIWW